MTTAATTIRIDIVSDVVCPWCIVGLKQLEKALASLEGEVIAEVHWHPFELNPQMPPEGQDLREHIAEKYGSSRADSDAARSRLTALGESLGFEFRFHEGMRIRNTFRAHQLLHWAGEQGAETALTRELFHSYFTLQENVDDPEALVATAARAGLDPAEATEILSDGRYADAVRQEERLWLQRGISAVPSFVFDERYLIPGAQDASVFASVLQKLREEPEDAPVDAERS